MRAPPSPDRTSSTGGFDFGQQPAGQRLRRRHLLRLRCARPHGLRIQAGEAHWHAEALAVAADQDVLGAMRCSWAARGGYDALGLCVFNLGATGRRPELVLAMLEQAYGLKLPDGWLEGLGRRVIEVERAFNRAAGFTAEDDRLPAYFSEEAVPSAGTRWDVPAEELDALWNQEAGL
jgi:aldehyde:ferredoxin oxidoreductase